MIEVASCDHVGRVEWRLSLHVLSVTYAAGAAAGPLLGGALQAQTDFRGQCTVTVTAALCLVFSIISKRKLIYSIR